MSIDKQSGTFIALKSKIYSNPYGMDYIEYFMNHFQVTFIKNKFDEFMQIPLIKSKTHSRYFPINIESLKKSEFIEYANLEKTLFWNALVIRHYSKSINKFIEFRNVFSFHLLLGEYEIADKVLDQICSEFGYSLWWIENKLALLEEIGGLKKQKEFTNTILKNETIEGIVRYLTYFYSMRAEFSISVDKYDQTIRKDIDDYQIAGLPSSLLNYLGYKLNYFNTLKITNHRDLFNNESNSSIIDIYTTYIQLSQNIIINNNVVDINPNSLFDSLKIVYSKINDHQLINNVLALNPQEKLRPIYIDTINKFIEILDLYTIGDYVQCIDKCEKMLKRSPYFIDICEILTKSRIRIGHYQNDEIAKKETPIAQLMRYMESIILYGPDCERNYKKLLKMTLLYSSQSWASQIVGFVNKEFISDRGPLGTNINQLLLLNAIPFSPRFVEIFMKGDNRNEYLNILRKAFPDSVALQMRLSINDDSNSSNTYNIPEYRYQKYIAISNLKLGLYSQALEIFNSNILQNDLLYKYDAIAGIIKCLTLEQNYAKLINCIVHYYFINKNIIRIIPLREIIYQLEAGEYEKLKDNIALSIVYDIFIRATNDECDNRIIELYEDYLNSNGVEKPSELLTVLDSTNSDYLIYFLKYVCSHNRLAYSIIYKNSVEAEQERIAIYQTLAVIDFPNQEEYMSEIQQISQKLIIRNVLRKYEQSKIYVDIPGIKNKLEKSIRESYNRYQSLSVLNESAIEDIVAQIKDMLPSVQSNSQKIIYIDRRERHELFKTMVIEIRDQFVSSNEYGLDTYLSTGIRHGTLVGQIRAIMENDNLMTQKESTSGEYLTNEYWLNKYCDIANESKAKLIVALNEFSRSIDEYIELIKRNLIQIKTESKNTQGLFDYCLSESLYYKMRNSIISNSEYDDFVDVVINTLWAITDDNLHTIKEYFSNIIKNEFDSIFMTLQNNLKHVGCDLKELAHDIQTAKTRILYELDKIATWFTRTRGSGNVDFPIEWPLEASFEMVKNCYPKKFINYNKNIKFNGMLKAFSLNAFCSLFYIIFDNIIKHDGAIGAVSDADISIISSDQYLTIEIKNKVYFSDNYEYEKQKIYDKREELIADEGIETVMTEGGTGFHKIKRLMRVDLRSKGHLDIDLKEDKFEIILKIDIKEILV